MKTRTFIISAAIIVIIWSSWDYMSIPVVPISILAVPEQLPGLLPPTHVRLQFFPGYWNQQGYLLLIETGSVGRGLKRDLDSLVFLKIKKKERHGLLNEGICLLFAFFFLLIYYGMRCSNHLS